MIVSADIAEAVAVAIFCFSELIFLFFDCFLFSLSLPPALSSWIYFFSFVFRSLVNFTQQEFESFNRCFGQPIDWFLPFAFIVINDRFRSTYTVCMCVDVDVLCWNGVFHLEVQSLWCYNRISPLAHAFFSSSLEIVFLRVCLESERASKRAGDWQRKWGEYVCEWEKEKIKWKIL